MLIQQFVVYLNLIPRNILQFYICVSYRRQLHCQTNTELTVMLSCKSIKTILNIYLQDTLILQISKRNSKWRWSCPAGIDTYLLATRARRDEKRYPAISTPFCQLENDMCLAITFSCQTCSGLLSLEVLGRTYDSEIYLGILINWFLF